MLERVQSAANPGVNATIRDKYFNSACATPVAGAEKKGTEMGRKYIVLYAFRRCEGYVSGKVTGFSEDDLELLWQAILSMFENDRAAALFAVAVDEAALPAGITCARMG